MRLNAISAVRPTVLSANCSNINRRLITMLLVIESLKKRLRKKMWISILRQKLTTHSHRQAGRPGNPVILDFSTCSNWSSPIPGAGGIPVISCSALGRYFPIEGPYCYSRTTGRHALLGSEEALLARVPSEQERSNPWEAFVTLGRTFRRDSNPELCHSLALDLILSRLCNLL